MRLMLTSFGIEQAIVGQPTRGSMFIRMPPVSFRRLSAAFVPDYELLLLSDSLVMDGESFGQLVESPLRAYSQVADTLRALRGEGRIELVDFVSILRANSDLLGRMIEHDMRVLDQWVEPLRRSLTAWQEFARQSVETIRWMADDLLFGHRVPLEMHQAAHGAGNISLLIDEALSSSEKRKRKEFRDPLREVLRSYLAYVNANLVLSNELGVAFHDWLDFSPFYTAKFLTVGRDRDSVQQGRDQLERLFTVSFPELAILDTKGLVRALNDKRLEDLRQLVADAVAGKVKFDEEFAKAVLTRVLRNETKTRKIRNVLGYATMPVGFLPWIGTPLQKLTEEAIGIPLERKMKARNKWFYMLSEIADSSESQKSSEDQRLNQ